MDGDLGRYLTDREAVLAEVAERWDATISPLGGVQLLRRDAVQQVLRDRRAEARVVAALEAQGVTSGPLYDSLDTSLLNMNGPEHLRLRALVLKAFTPTAVERFRPMMREIAGELLAPLIPTTPGVTGRCEVMDDIANQYPVQVICSVLGVPREDRHLFRAWLDTSSFALSMEAAARQDEILAANRSLDEYVSAIVAERRRLPGDDLISAMLAAVDTGVEGDDRLTDAEVVRMTSGLLFAGHDTTRNQIGRTLVAFAEHPDQWELLAGHPELAAKAVDEGLRFTPVVDGVAPRRLSADMTVGDLALPAGTVVNPCTYAANIDATGQPDGAPSLREFDIAADRPAHLTFGGGAHLCIGMSLARAEMAELFLAMSARVTNLRLDGEPVWPPAIGIWGPSSVPLAYEARA
jgi:cytochrome P450